MGFDGILRPSQVNPYTNPLNPYTADNLARVEQAGKPLIQKPTEEEALKALEEERKHDQEKDEDEQGESFSEEEAEEILLFAKMRGLMNVSMESGKRYEFHINPETGMVEMRELDSGELIIQLTPMELMNLSDKLQRYAGILMDRSG